MLKEFNEWLLTWKPIHLCWWFEKHNKPIPKYLIGGGGSPPSVTTNAATSVSYTTATLNGNVTSDGGATITARGFVYSSSDSTPTIGEGGVTDTGNLGGTTGTYTHNATGLSSATQYWYQAYAINAKGTTYGGVQTFTTLNNPPTVALNTPADTATGQSTTPTLEFTGTDAESNDVRYNVQVHTVDTFVVLADSYSESNVDAYFNLRAGDSDTYAAGQVITGISGVLNSAKFYLKKTGSPTGTVVVKIHTTTGTYGSTAEATDTVLATSETYATSSLTGSGQLIEFVFSGANKITLSSGTVYALVVHDSAGTSGNTVDVGYDSSSPSHGGNATQSDTVGWVAQSSFDTSFYIYTDPLINAVSGTDSGFANTVTPADTDPFNSGEKADYDVTDTLSNSTTYYWRARAIDPSGSNTYGAWATTRSFTTEAGGGGGNTRRYTLTTLGIG